MILLPTAYVEVLKAKKYSPDRSDRQKQFIAFLICAMLFYCSGKHMWYNHFTQSVVALEAGSKNPQSSAGT